MTSSPPFKPVFRIDPIDEYGIRVYWPPKVVWAREAGWLRVRDPWGTWHELPAREAPTGYPRLASEAKRR